MGVYLMGHGSDSKTNRSEVQTLYSTRARLYEKVFVKGLGWGNELEAFFRRSAYLQPSLKILDAGCGTGIVTRTLHKIMQEKGFSSEIHAFDLTQNMLDIFHQEISKHGLRNIELAQADVLRLDALPSTWNEYDLIISSALLEHIPEDQMGRAVRNLKDVLRVGGVLLLLLTKRTMISRVTGKLFWKTNLFDEADVQALLKSVGFHRIEFKKLPSAWSNHILVVEARK